MISISEQNSITVSFIPVIFRTFGDECVKFFCAVKLNLYEQIVGAIGRIYLSRFPQFLDLTWDSLFSASILLKMKGNILLSGLGFLSEHTSFSTSVRISFKAHAEINVADC